MKRFPFSASPTGSLALWLTLRRALLLITVYCSLITAPAAAATVTGTVRDSAGTLYSGEVKFVPDTLQRVRVIGADLLTPSLVTATATNGVVTATLREGDYYVGIGAAKQFRISVGAADGTFALLDLIVGGTDNIAPTVIGLALKADKTNAVVVGMTTPTAPTSSNDLVNLAALQAAIAASSGAGKLDTTNGVAVNLSGSLTNITVDGGYVLRIPPFTAAINEVTVPVAYQYFQRTNTSAGLITITANIAGPTGTAVEAKFGAGAWTSIGSSGTDGNITGYLAASVGQGALQVRLTGTTNATSIASVSVGDIFMLWGQSNASGRSTSNQSFTNTATLAGLYGNDAVWRTLVDPVDSATNQVDSISSDTDSGGMGSVWPIVANEVIAATGVPVAFVPCAKGSTGFGGSQPTWTPAADHFDTSTLFGSAMSRLRAIGGKVAAILWWQGEGGFDDTSGATYNTPFSTMAAVVAAEYPGTKIIPAKIQDCTGITSSRQTNGWYAIGLLWSTNSNVLRGPTLADAPVGGAGNIFAENETGTPYYHIKSSTNTVAAAHRWATNLIAHFP